MYVRRVVGAGTRSPIGGTRTPNRGAGQYGIASRCALRPSIYYKAGPHLWDRRFHSLDRSSEWTAAPGAAVHIVFGRRREDLESQTQILPGFTMVQGGSACRTMILIQPQPSVTA